MTAADLGRIVGETEQRLERDHNLDLCGLVTQVIGHLTGTVDDGHEGVGHAGRH